MPHITTSSTHSGDTSANEGGVVYVEFLIAFFPVFLLFLAICQLALLIAARVIVSHAAVVAVRSAIVVFNDPGGNYDGAPFGDLSKGRTSSRGADALTSVLGGSGGTSRSTANSQPQQSRPQRGTRMAPVRLASAVPLMTLAPSQSSLRLSKDAVDQSLSPGTSDLRFAFDYTAAAAAITVHSSESAEALAAEPLAPTQNVTVRVTYLYRCAIPLVRVLMCSTLARLLRTDPSNAEPRVARLRLAADAEQLKTWIASTERFTILTGIASLPNQGTDGVKEAEE